MEKLNAASAQSSSRTGSKSPAPPNGKPIPNAIRKSKSPQPPAVVAPVPVAKPAVEAVKDLASPPLPALAEEKAAAAVAAADDLANVNEKLAVIDAVLPSLTPVSPVTTQQASHKVTTVDDIFPDMVWEDEITDLLATESSAAPPLAPLAPVPVIVVPEPAAISNVPPQSDVDVAVSAARAKKDKSPGRQKAKSPAPKSVVEAVSETAAQASFETQQDQIPPLSPVSCPLVASVLPTQAAESEVKPDESLIPADAAADVVVSPPDSPPAPSSPQQAAASEKEISANVPSAGSQTKSKRKKNKSRSEDDPAIKSVSCAVAAPPAPTAPLDPPHNTLVSDIKQIREQISQTLVSNFFLFSPFPLTA